MVVVKEATSSASRLSTTASSPKTSSSRSPSRSSSISSSEVVEERGGETEGGAGPERGEQIGDESSFGVKFEAEEGEEEEWSSLASFLVVVVIVAPGIEAGWDVEACIVDEYFGLECTRLCVNTAAVGRFVRP